ncbi:MAG: protein tyrosine phosphatase, partial [Acidobacteria bacterium]|nr:protein tyrosine phosphatase [Acidobacteriota bacterium]
LRCLMIDLHAHILPAVDDGAGTFEEALAMCRRAAEEGCEAIVATPHQRHPRWGNDDVEALNQLRRNLQEALGSRLTIYSGGEVRVDSELLDAMDRPDREGILPLAGGRHLLIEFPRNEVGPNPVEIVHELAVAGWFPILAQPEVIPWLAHEIPLLERLVELGGRLQLTAMSFTGEFGRAPREAARKILDHGLGHLLASDCHGVERRPPGLRRAADLIAERWDREVATRLTYENPKAVLEDRPIAA